MSEKSILDRCEKRPKAAVLVISRTDKLRSDGDREKLRSRVERETSDYFRSIVMMRGKDVVIDASAGDEDAWIDTAAPELLQKLRELGAEVRTAQADALAAMTALADANAEAEVEPEGAKIVPLHEPAEPVPTGLAMAMAKARAHQTPAASAESAEPVTDAPSFSGDARSRLAALMPALHGCDAVGIAPLGDDGAVEFLKGQSADWPEIGTACRSMYRAEVKLDPEAADEPLQSHMSLNRHQLITQSYPRRGLTLFMIAPTARMNHGIARTRLHPFDKGAGTGALSVLRLARLCGLLRSVEGLQQAFEQGQTTRLLFAVPHDLL